MAMRILKMPIVTNRQAYCTKLLNEQFSNYYFHFKQVLKLQYEYLCSVSKIRTNCDVIAKKCNYNKQWLWANVPCVRAKEFWAL